MAVQALEVLMPFSPPSAAALVITGVDHERSPSPRTTQSIPTQDRAVDSHLSTSSARR